MIARKIVKRKSQVSNYRALVRYICSAHGKEERLGVITITNSDAQTPEDLGQEVVLTQLYNDRARSDKTYHLLLSFPPGEQPSAEVLAQIEHRICDELGFGEHQRISAVHHDTDDLHVHVAINKIHPSRFTIQDPKFDFRILGKTCLQLEAEFGLIATNHEPGKTVGEGRADDMVRIAGLEPLRDYVNRTCPELARVASWQELHDQLGEAGLTLEPRKAGLVILDGQGRGVKPSTISRDFAKARLEARLGPFTAATVAAPAARQVYSPAPSTTPSRTPRVDTKDLYARYTAEQASNKAGQAAKSAASSQKIRAQLAVLKAQAELQRKIIRLAPAGGPRAALRANHAATYRAAVGEVLATSKDERQRLRSGDRAIGWLEWLQAQALAGDPQALAALRDRATSKPRPVAGVESGQGGAPLAADGVTKTGVVIYRTAEATVRDDGARLHVSRGVQDKGLLVALQIAKERHGGVLRVAGDASFQGRVARLAALTDPTIRFADPALERHRAAIAGKLEETHHDGRIGPGGARTGLGAGGGGPGAVPHARSAAELARTAVRILRGPHGGGCRVGQPGRPYEGWGFDPHHGRDRAGEGAAPVARLGVGHPARAGC